MPRRDNAGLALCLSASLAACLVVACSPGGERSPADRMAARHGVADLVFFNGTVITMDARVPAARAIAIREGRIIALGDDADIEPLSNAATHLEDLEGRTLMPGLLDDRDPDRGRAAPVCLDPPPAGALPVPAPPREPDLSARTAEGVVGLRLPRVSVDDLPVLVANARRQSAPMHLRVAHWPACGASQRSLLQQVMRGLAETPVAGRGSFRVELDPAPAVAAPPPVATEGATGVTPSMPAEAPAAPPQFPSPWQVIAEALPAPGPDRRKALRAFTVDAARSLGLSGEAGMLAPGMRADLVVLDRNPLDEPPERVAETVVLQTWFGGERVFGRAGEESP